MDNQLKKTSAWVNGLVARATETEKVNKKDNEKK